MRIHSSLGIGRVLLPGLVLGALWSAPRQAQAACCSPDRADCDLGPTSHWEARCRVGEEITDGDLSNVFDCWTSGFIFINPANPFTWLAALAAGELYCDGHYTENVCAPKDHSSEVETANGLDDNCDGTGIGDEFCDGVDNDGDGHIDEDTGSCLLRFLAVPLCWQGTDAAFTAAVQNQTQVFLEAAGLDGCASSVRFETILPSQFNVPCPGGTTSLDNIENSVVAAALPGIRLDDFDALAGFTDRDLDGTARGATDTLGRFWAETTIIGTSQPDIVSAHEFGHVLGLDDEYCSSHSSANGSSACNNPSASINFLGGDLGCDPANANCCSIAFRNPNAPPGEYPDNNSPCAGQYNRCCVGNLAVEDPTASTLTNDATGRCVMGSSFEQGPRHYCQRCLGHIRSANLVCGTRHSGQRRILVARGVVSPTPIRLGSVSYIDGRAGLQNVSPVTHGDVVLEFRDVTSNSVIAVRGLSLPTTGSTGEFAVENSFSLRIPLPDGVGNDAKIRVVTSTGGATVGQTTINGSPPVANAGADRTIECTGPTTPVTLSGAASSDADGDSLRFLWRPSMTQSPTLSVDLELGRHEFELVVDDGLYTSADQVAITIRDTTKPTLQVQPMSTFVGCTNAPSRLSLPVVGDVCSEVRLTGSVVASTNPGLALPIDVSSGTATLPVGVHTIEWSAVDSSGNTTTVRQDVRVASALHAASTIDVRDYSQILVAGASGAYAQVTSAGRMEVGYDADLGSVTTGGDILLRNLAVVHGDARSGGAINGQPLIRSQVTGVLAPNSAVGFPPGYGDLSGLTVPSSNVSIELEPTKLASAAPGVYDTLSIKRDAILTLTSAGTYYARRLLLDDAGNLALPRDVTIVVKDELMVRGNISTPVAIAFLGSNLAPIDRPFTGTLVAPRASVNISANYRGWLVGGNVLIAPRTTVSCDPASPNPSLVFR